MDELLHYTVAEHQQMGTMLKDLQENLVTSQVNLSRQLGKTKARRTHQYKWLCNCEKACSTLKCYLEEIMLNDYPDDSSYPNGDPLAIYYGKKNEEL